MGTSKLLHRFIPLEKLTFEFKTELGFVSSLASTAIRFINDFQNVEF